MPGKVLVLVALLTAGSIAIALVASQPGVTRTVLFAGPESAELDLGAGPELGFGRSSFEAESPTDDVSADGKWFRSTPSAEWERASDLGDPVHDMDLAHIARVEARDAGIMTKGQRRFPRLRANNLARTELTSDESEDESPRCRPHALIRHPSPPASSRITLTASASSAADSSTAAARVLGPQVRHSGDCRRRCGGR